MSRPIRLAVLLVGALGCGDSNGPVTPVDEGDPPTAGCTGGTLEAGALYQVCFPSSWNGDLVIYAHGYVPAGNPVALPDDAVGGASLSATVTGLGYAFASTSYRANGLVADRAVGDVEQVVETVRRLYRPDPVRVYLVGASEGGLVTALAVERSPGLYAGALAACGPVGDFARQIDYFGDFRVVFDYFFPDVLPGSPVEIPQSLRDHWPDTYAPAVLDAIQTDPSATQQLLAVTGAPIDASNPSSVGNTVLEVLFYNVYATTDAEAILGGQPYDNAARVYAGSDDDVALNAGVARFSADPPARADISRFETSGDLPVPVVTIHTTGDPIVPFEQEALYATKVASQGASARLQQQTVDRYDHCNFTGGELLGAFGTLVSQVTAAAAVAVTP
jgi:pimeloyl-ACP methyl ester carboxylesterase